MPRITFIKPYEVKDGTGTKYRDGDGIECNDASAAHFITRGVAVLEDVAKKAKAPAKTESESTSVPGPKNPPRPKIDKEVG